MFLESVDKWKKVGDIALMAGSFELAERCFEKSQDFNSQMLFYSSYGDLEGLQRLVDIPNQNIQLFMHRFQINIEQLFFSNNADKSGKYNVAFEAAYLIGDADKCVQILLKSKRVSEAAFFARAYAPSKLSLVMKQWEEELKIKQLPFKPEDILNLDSHAEIMEEALKLEEMLSSKIYKAPIRPAATDYEKLKEEYYSQDVIQASPVSQSERNGKVDSVKSGSASAKASPAGGIEEEIVDGALE